MSGVPGPRQPVSLTVNTAQVVRSIRQAPRVAYFWLRAYLFQLALEHRKQWLRMKGTRFNRISSGGRGIVVSKVNEGRVPPADNEVAYVVEPRESRMPTNAFALQAIPKLRADIYTGNKILPVHEEGGDIRSSGWMVVPYKTRPGNIHRWRQRNPSKRLITLPSKKSPQMRMVYEVALARLRGRVSKDWIGPAPMREKLRLRFVLTKHVKMKATLRLYSSWDQMQGAQDALWQKFADRLMLDVQHGVAS